MQPANVPLPRSVLFVLCHLSNCLDRTIPSTSTALAARYFSTKLWPQRLRTTSTYSLTVVALAPLSTEKPTRAPTHLKEKYTHEKHDRDQAMAEANSNTNGPPDPEAPLPNNLGPNLTPLPPGPGNRKAVGRRTVDSTHHRKRAIEPNSATPVDFILHETDSGARVRQGV